MKSAQAKILLIDDEAAVFETVSAYGEKENMEVKYANSGELGLEFFNKVKFDAIIVDWMLPEISGPEIIKAIRKKSNVPILMISARDDESDIVLEILDARLVELSRNEEVERLIEEEGRPVIYVVNKSDLVNKDSIRRQIKELEKKGEVELSDGK